MKKIFLLFILMGFMSCKKKQDDKPAVLDNTQKKESKITKQTIENLKYQDYLLDDKSERLIENWPKYQELIAQVELLKQADFSFFKGDKETIRGLITDLKAEIPEQVNSNPVKSRIVVVETSILKLHNELNLDYPNREELLESIREVLFAMSNLNLQVNKKLEFDANNINRPE